MVYDVTSAALHSALRGLSTRRRVIAENIANVDTPNYLAGTVDFESSLSAALDGAGRGFGDMSRGTAGLASVMPSNGTSTAATRLNGNNVSIDDEILNATETELAYNTILEAMNGKFRLLRTAINSGGM